MAPEDKESTDKSRDRSDRKPGGRPRSGPSAGGPKRFDKGRSASGGPSRSARRSPDDRPDRRGQDSRGGGPRRQSTGYSKGGGGRDGDRGGRGGRDGGRGGRDDSRGGARRSGGYTRGSKDSDRSSGRGRGPRPEGRGRGSDKPYRHSEGAGAPSDYNPKLVATCALGLELTVGRELEALDLGPIQRDNAQVSFPYSPHAVAKSNYWLRTADRVWMQLAEFSCRDFEELFQGVKAIDWPAFLPRDAYFPVEAISTKSQLESVSSCQSVTKKATVDKMRSVYGPGAFPETGAKFAIRVFIVYNRARVFIDTSGEGLHRRGYRTYNAQAPLRETVAAGLVLLSHWSPDRELYDPMCGSGTILLEAACIGLKKAAGCERSFASQRWGFLGRECWELVHKEAMDLYIRRGQLKLYGSDTDGRVLKLSRTHLEQSGLEGRGIYFQKRDLADFSSQRKYGVVITNPPYGHRMGTEEEVADLTRNMAEVFEPLAETWSLYYYTGYERFVEHYGRKPDRVRKIYNGKIQANLLQYPGPRPPDNLTGSDFGGTQPVRKRIPLKP